MHQKSVLRSSPVPPTITADHTVNATCSAGTQRNPPLSRPSADVKWCLSVGRRLGSRSTAPKPSPPTSYAKHARNVTKLYTLTNRLRQAGRGHNQFVYSHEPATLTNRPASPDCGLSPTGFVNANHRYLQRSNHRNRLRQPTTNDRQLTTDNHRNRLPAANYQLPATNYQPAGIANGPRTGQSR